MVNGSNIVYAVEGIYHWLIQIFNTRGATILREVSSDILSDAFASRYLKDKLVKEACDRAYQTLQSPLCLLIAS